MMIGVAELAESSLSKDSQSASACAEVLLSYWISVKSKVMFGAM